MWQPPQPPTKRFQIISILISLGLLLANIATAVIAYAAINKVTPLYEIERGSYYEKQLGEEEKLNYKLGTGKYTLLLWKELGINTPNYGDKYSYVLGRIKK